MLFKVLTNKLPVHAGRFAMSLAVTLTITTLLNTSKLNAADNYQVTDLGKFTDGIYQTVAVDINDSGLVTGYAVQAGVVETINDNVSTFTDVQFLHAFTFESGQVDLLDLGAIDNSDVSVEITNNDDNGEPETTTVDLGQEYTSSLGFGVSDQGTVVGVSSRIWGSVVSSESEGVITETANSTLAERAIFVESGSDTILEVPDFVDGVHLDMRAIGIKDDLVVGFGKYNDPDDVDDAGASIDTIIESGFVYDISSGELTRVAPLEGGLSISLRDINSSGYAVGVSGQFIDEVGSREVVGFDLNSSQDAVKIDIFGTNQQQAWAINDAGIIVGRALRAEESVFTAFSYDLVTQTAKDLGVLNENFASAVAFDINGSGQIVGTSQFQNLPVVYHAFIYENGEMKDLDKLIGCNTGWRLDEANAINDSGVIVGKGIFNGEIRSFMLTPQEGTAPNCEIEDDKGDGSIPLWGVLALLGAGLFRRFNVVIPNK